jgi:hypothetical protein
VLKAALAPAASTALRKVRRVKRCWGVTRVEYFMAV